MSASTLRSSWSTPATDNATGRLLLVQSKGRTAPFDRETDDAFTFRCSPEDLEYWMTATAPVLLVCSHPAQRLAWFKNLHAWFDDPQRRRARIVEFDKNADILDVSASQRLLDWAVPASTGIYLQPPPKAESLATNLLRVEHVGPYIYAAASDVKGWSDINARLRAAGRDLVDDVAWRSNTLYSFRRLDEPPLDALVDDAPERFDVEEFAETDSDDDRHLVVRLLNNTPKDMFRGHLSWHRDRQFFYFPATASSSTSPPTANLQPRKVRVDKRGTGRTVFQRYSSEDAPGRPTYYRHYALRAQFQRIDDGWVLALEPTYHFTVDGRTESRYTPALLSGIKRLERQQAVAHLVRFWAGYLRGDYDLFSTRDPRILFGALAQVDVDRGIDDAYWKPNTTDIAVDRDQPETSATGQSSMFGDS